MEGKKVGRRIFSLALGVGLLVSSITNVSSAYAETKKYNKVEKVAVVGKKYVKSKAVKKKPVVKSKAVKKKPVAKSKAVNKKPVVKSKAVNKKPIVKSKESLPEKINTSNTNSNNKSSTINYEVAKDFTKQKELGEYKGVKIYGYGTLDYFIVKNMGLNHFL